VADDRPFGIQKAFIKVDLDKAKATRNRLPFSSSASLPVTIARWLCERGG